MIFIINKKGLVHKISYPANVAAVVFGVYLSAQATYRLDSECSRKPPMPIASVVKRSKINY